MALELPALIQKFVLDTSGVSKGIQQAESDVKKSTKGMSDAAEEGASKSGASLDKFMDKAGKVGTSMSKFVTAPILGAGVVAFKFASDLNESLSKVNVVFDKNGKQIEAWSKTAATSLGMSQQKALEAAGTFGNLFRAMDIGLKPATDMSKNIIGLSADLASFNNANPDDVLLALRAGLVGEAEPLRKFGVNINQARIEAEAFALGLAKPVKNAPLIAKAHLDVTKAQKELTQAQKAHGATSAAAVEAGAKLATAQGRLDKALEGSTVELTAAQKAQASYSLIMKDTTLAQGDFGRTADGAANKSRILKAQMEDLAAGIGQKLLPIGTKLIGWASQAVSVFTKIPGPVQNIVLVLAGLAAAAGPLLLVSSKLYDAWGKIGPLFSKIGPKILQMIVPTEALTAATAEQTVANEALNTSFLANPIVLIVAAVVALGVALFALYKKFEPFRNLVDKIFDPFQKAFSWVREQFLLFKSWVTAALKGFDNDDHVHGFAKVISTVAIAFARVIEVGRKAMGAIKQIIGVMFQGDFKGGGPFAEDSPFISGLFTFREIVGKVMAVVTTVIKTAFEVISKAISFVADHWKLFALGFAIVFAPVLTAIGAAIFVFVKFRDQIMAVVGAVITILKFLFENVVKPYFAILGFIIGTAIDIFLHWKNVIVEVVGFIGTVISFLWDSVLKPVFGFIVDFIKAYVIVYFTIWKTIVETVITVIATVVTWLWDSVLKPIFGFIVAIIQNVVIPIFNVYRGVVETVFRAIATVASWLWDNVLQPVFSKMKSFIEAVLLPVFRVIGTVFKDAFEGVASVASSVWEKIKGAFSGGLSFLGKIVGGFLKIVSGIARAVGATGLADTISSAGDSARSWGSGGDSGGGGSSKAPTKAFARGGIPPAAVGDGFMTDGPRAIVGEGRSAYPEYVIPTDPQYRNRATGLAWDLMKKLGIEAHKRGGMIPKYGIGGVLDNAWDATGGKAVSAIGDAAGGAVKWVRGQVGKAVGAVWPTLDTDKGMGAGIAAGAMNKIRQSVIDFIQGSENKKIASEMGDLVSVTKTMISMFGVRASEHPAFGGVTAGAHAPGSYHYKGQAVDMNYGAAGSPANEAPVLDKVYGYIKTNVDHYKELLWKVAGHFDHLHLAMEKGGLMNPHVRDAGGPLLPGYTYNGTGKREEVIRSRPPRLDVNGQIGGYAYGASIDPRRVEAHAGGAGVGVSRDGDTITINANTNADPHEIVAEVMFAKRIRNR